MTRSILEPPCVGNVNNSLVLNRNHIPRENLAILPSSPQPSNNSMETYLTKAARSLNSRFSSMGSLSLVDSRGRSLSSIFLGQEAAQHRDPGSKGCTILLALVSWCLVGQQPVICTANLGSSAPAKTFREISGEKNGKNSVLILTGEELSQGFMQTNI
ncbi:uncharacterized protein ACIGJ3_004542 isoform 2-T2 [Trichechus inunguis]